MKIVKSPLIIKDFVVLNSECRFVEPKKDVIPKEIFEKYNIDFDFGFDENDDKEILIFTKILINNNKRPLPGYVINMESVSYFELNEKGNLSEKDIFDLIFYSALGIAISNLRTFIINVTKNFPFDTYQFPAIDIIKLHSQKKKEVKKLKQNANIQ